MKSKICPGSIGPGAGGRAGIDPRPPLVPSDPSVPRLGLESDELT